MTTGRPESYEGGYKYDENKKWRKAHGEWGELTVQLEPIFQPNKVAGEFSVNTREWFIALAAFFRGRFGNLVRLPALAAWQRTRAGGMVFEVNLNALASNTASSQRNLQRFYMTTITMSCRCSTGSEIGRYWRWVVCGEAARVAWRTIPSRGIMTARTAATDRRGKCFSVPEGVAAARFARRHAIITTSSYVLPVYLSRRIVASVVLAVEPAGQVCHGTLTVEALGSRFLVVLFPAFLSTTERRNTHFSHISGNETMEMLSKVDNQFHGYRFRFIRCVSSFALCHVV